jgi:porphobilinogen synthase
MLKTVGTYPNTRLRRNRKKDWTRRLVQENDLSTNDLIWPIFIREGRNIKEPIKTMPGIYRHSLDRIEKMVENAMTKKIPMIALFPSTPSKKKKQKWIRSFK